MIKMIGSAVETGLVILVVLLVILGLIIGFNKLREQDEDGFKEQLICPKCGHRFEK